MLFGGGKTWLYYCRPCLSVSAQLWYYSSPREIDLASSGLSLVWSLQPWRVKPGRFAPAAEVNFIRFHFAPVSPGLHTTVKNGLNAVASRLGTESAVVVSTYLDTAGA